MNLSDPRNEAARDTVILAVIAVLTLFLRYLTLMEVNVGGDNIDYWYYGKSLLMGYPYDLYFHRAVRWGIILPTLFVQLLFGTHAWGIYLPPILMSVLLNYSVFLVGRRLFDRRTALYSLVIIQFFPYMIRMGSQLFLGVFSMNYILLSLLFLLKFIDPRDEEKKRETLWMVLSLLFLFAAYLTKITNLYFLIPWAILIFKKKGSKSLFLYGVLLFGLYLLEHISYFLILDEPLGRLGIIASTHLGNSTMEVGTGHSDGTFLGLFKRYSLEHFPLYWQTLLWGGMISLFLLYRKDTRRESLNILLLISGTFLFLITFGITSIRPVQAFENYHSRYFSSILPLLALLISRFLISLKPGVTAGLPPIIRKYEASLLFLLGILGILFLSFMLPYLPSSAGEYLNNPFKQGDHILTKVIQWEKQINDAAEKDILLRSWIDGPDDISDKRNSKKNLDTVNRLYLKLPKGKGKYPESFFREDSLQYKWIEYGGGTPERHSSVYTFFREPFALAEEP